MAQAKRIDRKYIADLVARTSFNEELLTKDYYLTEILYLIKDMEGIYFKGGTALHKIFLNYSRLSEDVDLTLTRDVKEVIKEITKILEDSKLFDKITKDKDVEGFTRLVAHYKSFSGKDETVFIDLNQRAKLLTKPESHKIMHFYKDNIPDFSSPTLSKEEMIAEKVAAAIGRNRPRDHFDIYMIIKAKIPISMKLVAEKCRQSKVEFSIIKMFNKASRLKHRWDNDLLPLLAEEITFEEVMKTLARHFKLKEEKDKKK